MCNEQKEVNKDKDNTIKKLSNMLETEEEKCKKLTKSSYENQIKCVDLVTKYKETLSEYEISQSKCEESQTQYKDSLLHYKELEIKYENMSMSCSIELLENKQKINDMYTEYADAINEVCDKNNKLEEQLKPAILHITSHERENAKII